MNYLKDLIDSFSLLPEVCGILLGGSRSTKSFDKLSDYDIYVYINKELQLEKRKIICEKLFEYYELNNTFWEAEDNGILKRNKYLVDIVYRKISWLDEYLNNLLFEYEVNIGYTTCIWYNFINSKILFQRNNSISQLMQKYNIPYPEKLKINIIKKNHILLKEGLSSYYNQIRKAIKRNDIISINHRITVFLASYFDIIFAVNEMAHPGEKNLLNIIKETCKKVPLNMVYNIEKLLNCKSTKNEIVKHLDIIISNLNELLKNEELILY